MMQLLMEYGHAICRRMARVCATVIASFALAVCLLLSYSPDAASAALGVPPVFTAPIQVAGLTETWTISGWQGSGSNHISSATVTFPAGFVIPATPTVTVTANALVCTVARATRTNQSVAIEIVGGCDTGPAAPYTNPVGRQSITIAGVTNPVAAGTMAATGFTLRTSADTETSASARVVIWGVAITPTVCNASGGLSRGEVTFVATGEGTAANTGSATSAPLLITVSSGWFRLTPQFVGGALGVIDNAATTTTSAQAVVSAGVVTGSSLVVSVGRSSPGVVTATLQVSPMTGGTPVVLGSSEVTFTGEGVCVPPPAPAPVAGTFSGGTIAPAGISLVTFTGTLAQLSTAGTTSKVVSVTAVTGGRLLTFVVGAPDFANADFAAVFPSGFSGALVIVKV